MSWRRSGADFLPSRRVRKRSRWARGKQVSMQVRSCYRVLNFIFLNDLLGLTSASMSRRAACCPLRQRGRRSSNCPVQYQNSHRIQQSEKKYRSWNYSFWQSMAGRENRSRSTRNQCKPLEEHPQPAQTGEIEGTCQHSKIFADCGRKFQTIGQRRGRKSTLGGRMAPRRAAIASWGKVACFRRVPWLF